MSNSSQAIPDDLLSELSDLLLQLGIKRSEPVSTIGLKIARFVYLRLIQDSSDGNASVV